MVSTMKGDFLWEKIVVEKYFKKGFREQLETTEIGFCGVFILRLREISGFREKKSYRK